MTENNSFLHIYISTVSTVGMWLCYKPNCKQSFRGMFAFTHYIYYI